VLLSTKTKITLARLAARVLSWGIGGHGLKQVSRKGINWRLDLRQGIDFSIYLLGSFEPGTVRRYKRMLHKNDVVIDIGANIGAHTLHFAQAVEPGGRVVAIEPTRYAFSRLVENLSLNPGLVPRVTAIQAMLVSDSSQTLAPELFASWPLTEGNNVHPLHQGVAHSTAGAKAKTLDQIVSECGLDKINLIKLDVDGYELEVLRGAADSLARFRPTIILECAPYTLEERGDDPSELGAIFAKYGYRITDMTDRPIRLDAAYLAGIPAGASINLIALPVHASGGK
jgi:FkbM family methyltransferase